MPPPDRDRVGSELAALASLTDASAKGRRLEVLIRSIFAQVPGLSLEDQDVVNAWGTQEMDLYFFNAREREGLHFLDCPLIVECKGWSAPVDGRELRWFADMLRDKGRRDGIFIALNGLTGRAQRRTAGFYHVTRALADGQLVLVLTGEDLVKAGDSAGLVALLRRRMLDQVKGQVLALEAAESPRPPRPPRRRKPAAPS